MEFVLEPMVDPMMILWWNL